MSKAFFSCPVVADYFSPMAMLSNVMLEAVLRIHFWYGSGSADPYLGLMDPDADPDPALFVSDIQGVNKSLFAFYFLKVHLHHFSKTKSHKEVTKNVLLFIIFG
jgi:hypothetical protein